MKKYLLLLIVLSAVKVTTAQTLQTVTNNGNSTTTAVKFLGHADFGEIIDVGAYGAVQIGRSANQGSAFHLSFIREGMMVYGMGFLNNSNVFAIQPSNNGSTNGIFMTTDGKIGIGNSNPAELLSVKGKIRAQEVKVESANWPDFVFAKTYRLPSLQETEKHILANGHLPGIPSAAEVGKDGIELGEMNKKLLQKVEELTLHLIRQEKLINKQFSKSTAQEVRLNRQQREINNLKKSKKI